MPSILRHTHAIPTVITDPELLLDFARDFEKVIFPTSLRRSYTNSRLLIPHGGGAPVPVLLYAAKKKFPLWDTETHYPFWKDMNWTNESLENIDLASKVSARPQRQKNTSGFPTGSPEYMKWYRAKHPEKFRAAQKRAYLKRRDAAREAKKVEQENVALRAQLAKLSAEAPKDLDTVALASELDQIISLVGGPNSASPSPYNEVEIRDEERLPPTKTQSE